MYPSAMRFRRVLVLTGDHSLADPTKWEGCYTREDIALHDAMKEALLGLPGYEFSFLTRHDRLIETLRDQRPDFVLNLCDTGLGNIAARELHVPALLEVLGIPYSGAPPACMVLCYDKAIVRLVAAEMGIPVPREIAIHPERDLETIQAFYPSLIKPARGDGSVGIRPDAVVRGPAQARDYLAWFRTELPGRIALMQEYLPGAEYGLALVGNPGTGLTAFPPLEVDYSGLPRELSPILAFESKTAPETPYSQVAIRQARLPAGTVEELRRRSAILFERLECRDYARFDFRTGEDGEIKLLEVNPNPAWSREAKLARMARFAGHDYPDLLRMILEAARSRIQASAEAY